MNLLKHKRGAFMAGLLLAGLGFGFAATEAEAQYRGRYYGRGYSGRSYRPYYRSAPRYYGGVRYARPYRSYSFGFSYGPRYYPRYYTYPRYYSPSYVYPYSHGYYDYGYPSYGGYSIDVDIDYDD